MDWVSIPHALAVAQSFGTDTWTGRFRTAVRNIVKHVWFDRIVMLCILGNSIALAFEDPLDNDPTTTPNRILKVSDITFQVIFTIEMIMKLIGLGWRRIPDGYAREWWNILDCLLVISGWAVYVVNLARDGTDDSNISVIRVVRVLRPLRAVNHFPGLKMLIDMMMTSLPQLLNVMGLCAFIFFIFGIVGVQLFAGNLNQRCYYPPSPGHSEFVLFENDDHLCKMEDSSYGRPCPVVDGIQTVCIRGDTSMSPNGGITNFDTIFRAFLTIFQCITLEGWVDMMYWTEDTTTSWVAVYYIALITFGSLFLLNLIIAVIALNLSVERVVTEKKEKAKEWELIAESSAAVDGGVSATLSAVIAATYNKDANIALTSSRGGIVHDAPDIMAQRRAHVRAREAQSFIVSQALQHSSSDSKGTPNSKSPKRSPQRTPGGLQFIGEGSGSAEVGDGVNAIANGEKKDGTGDNESQVPAGAFVIDLHRTGSSRNLHDGPDRDALIGEASDAATAAVSYIRRGQLENAVDSLGDAWAMLASLPDVTPSRVIGEERLREIEREKGAASPEGEEVERSFSRFKPRISAPYWRRLCFTLVTNKYFHAFVFSLIVVNTVVLALEHHDQDEVWTRVLGDFNVTLTLLFTLEMAFKIGGLTLEGYVTDGFNVFDGVIVLVSLLDLAISQGGDSSIAVSALRTFRLLRIFKLARSWKSLNAFLSTMIHTLPRLGPFSVILLLFMYIFSLLGMQLFGGKLGSPPPRAHYDTLLWSFTTTFQVLTGENWNEVMYSTMENVGWASSLYFLALVCIGAFIVLNVFLAILIDNFSSDDDDETDLDEVGKKKLDDDIEQHLKRRQTFRELAGAASEQGMEVGDAGSKVVPVGAGTRAEGAEAGSVASGGDAGGSGATEVRAVEQAWSGGGAGKHSESVPVRHTSGDSAGMASVASGGSSPSGRKERPNSITNRLRKGTMKNSQEAESKLWSTAQNLANFSKRDAAEVTEQELAEIERIRSMYAKAKKQLVQDFSRHASYDHKAFFCIWGDNPVRYVFGTIALHPFFDYAVLCLIAVSCIFLALDSPDNPEELRSFLSDADPVISVMFAIEMFIKVIAFGFIGHEGSYARNWWNVLDGLIVVTSIADELLDSDLKVLKVFRLFRAMRPLRVVRRLEGLRTVVNAVLKALPACVHVGLVCVLFFLIFGIIGVNFFGGKLYRCTDETRKCLPRLAPDCPLELACIGSWTPPGSDTPIPRAWVDPTYSSTGSRYSFDHVGLAMVTLFEVASLELWLDVMYECSDITKLGWAPERDANSAAVVFFMVVIVVASFFMLQLFVTVVVDNFGKIKREMQLSSVFMTESQQQWAAIQRQVAKMKPMTPKTLPPSAPQHRQLAFSLVTKRKFELFVMGLIMANVLLMASRHYNASDTYNDAFDVINMVFSCIFLLEVIVKMIGLTVRGYFASKWNIFDFTIVSINWIAFILTAVWDDLGVDFKVLRVVRVARMFRLVRTSMRLRAIFFTLMISLPSLANVGALLLLLYFIFSVAAQNLFWEVPFGSFVDEHANFRSFWRSMVTMFRMSTGESWNGLMHECAKHTSDSVALVFFGSFVVLGQFLMLNLFVAVILENFENEMAANEEDGKVKKSDLESFADVWDSLCIEQQWRQRRHDRVLESGSEQSTTDPFDNSWLPQEALRHIVLRLPRPLGLPPLLRTSEHVVNATIEQLRVPVVDGMIEYTSTLRQFALRVTRGDHLPALKTTVSQKGSNLSHAASRSGFAASGRPPMMLSIADADQSDSDDGRESPVHRIDLPGAVPRSESKADPPIVVVATPGANNVADKTSAEGASAGKSAGTSELDDLLETTRASPLAASGGLGGPARRGTGTDAGADVGANASLDAGVATSAAVDAAEIAGDKTDAKTRTAPVDEDDEEVDIDALIESTAESGEEFLPQTLPQRRSASDGGSAAD